MATDPEAAATLDPLVRTRILSRLGGAGQAVVAAGHHPVLRRAPADRLELRRWTMARCRVGAPRTQAEITDLSRPENTFERSQGKLLEVYRPVWTPDGHELLFETYFRYGG